VIGTSALNKITAINNARIKAAQRVPSFDANIMPPNLVCNQDIILIVV
jgi:hypothetical protein